MQNRISPQERTVATAQRYVHAVPLVYAAFFGLLSLSVFLGGGSSYAPLLVAYVVVFLLSYAVMTRFVANRGIARTSIAALDRLKPQIPRIALALGVCTVLMIAYHMFVLGRVPILLAFDTVDYLEIVRIRQDATYDLPRHLKYVREFLLKAVLPFLILYFYVARKRMAFCLFLVLAIAYGLSQMQKFYVLTPVIPVLVLLLQQRRWLRFAVVAAFPVVGIVLLAYVTNPSFRIGSAPSTSTHATHPGTSGRPKMFDDAPNETPIEFLAEATERATGIADVLYERLLIVPGQVARNWFDLVPAKIPYGQGCGYRWLAPLLGCRFIDFSEVTYQIQYPEYASRGIRGLMTAGTAVNDYANFGPTGLIVGGVVLALAFVVVRILFRGAEYLLLPLNLLPAMALIEGPLTTVALSGGWGLTLLLFLLFRPGITVGQDSGAEEHAQGSGAAAHETRQSSD
jgi:hypothetical protein